MAGDFYLLCEPGVYDIVGAPSFSDFELDAATGAYQIKPETANLTTTPATLIAETGHYNISPQQAVFVAQGNPAVLIADPGLYTVTGFAATLAPANPIQRPVPYQPVTSRRMNWDTAVRMAGGFTQPYPFETYRFGGGQVQRSFFEDV